MKWFRCLLALGLALRVVGAVEGQEAPEPAEAAVPATAEAPREESFPHLSGAPLDSVAWITGRLSQLDPVSEDDNAERELLLRVLDHLETRPQLRRSALIDLRRDLRSRLSAAEAAFNESDETARDAAAQRVLAAQRDVERLEQLLRDLRRHDVAGDPPPSPEEDVALLQGENAEAAASRLTLLLPFLDQDSAVAVQAALETLEPKDPGADLLADFARDVSLSEDQLREAREDIERRRDKIAAIEAEAHGRLATAAKEAEEIDGRAIQPNDANHREADARALYAQLRGFVDALREEVADAGSEYIAAQRRLASARLEVAQGRRGVEAWKAPSAGTRPSAEDLQRWERNLEDRLRIIESLVALEQRHRDLMFVLLKDTKRLRRGFENVVPAATRRGDRDYLFADLDSEARLILPLVKVLARHRLETLLELPTRWRDVAFWSGAFTGLLWFLLIAALWWITRRVARGAAPHVVRLWASRSQRYVPDDLWGMRDSAEKTATSLVDLVAMGVMLRYVRAAVPELGLVLLVALQFTLYRLILGAAALAFATHPAVRPALLTLAPEARKLALRSVRYFVLWLIAGQFLRYCALEILGAVTLEELLTFVFNGLLIVLALWIFHVWEPHLREALVRRDPLHRLVVLLTGRQLGLLRAFQGLAHCVLLAYLWARDLVTRIGGWGSVLDSLKRSRAEGAEGKPPELPGEVVKLLLRRDCPAGTFMDRKSAREELDTRLERWLATKRRGVAVVLGDSGMGKHSFLESWCRSIAPAGTVDPDGPAILRLALRERMTRAEDALRWFGESFGIDNPPSDPGALAGRLQSATGRQIVVVENLQFAFLRTVDGFAALNFLLSVVGSSCDQVLWVFSMHLPSWRYLSSLGGLVHTEIFHTLVELRPFDEDELRWIVERRNEATRHEIGFSRLLPRPEQWRANPLALERVTTEYFRRLAWASQGNPSVALRLWRETLTIDGVAVDEPPGRLEVGSYPQAPGLGDLRDSDLFLLAALHTHRSLTEHELVQVTNMGPALVSAALRNLEGRRLLATRSKRFDIDPRHMPAVTSDLRRRHFIHGNA